MNPPTAPELGRRLRVVYLDHCARLSGAELALSRLLPSLTDRVEPLVVLGEDGPLVERISSTGIAVRVMPMASDLRDVRKDTVTPGGFRVTPMLHLVAHIIGLVRFLRAARPDIIHTNSLKAALYGGVAGRLAGIPVVWHVRDRIAEDYLPRPAVAMVRVLARVLPSAVVANSQATLETLPSSVSGAVVFNPVVYDSVTMPERRGVRVEGVLRVGVVGRLAPWKGQHVFLEAFARSLAGSGAQAWLIGSAMFGEEEYERQLHDQVAALGIGSQVSFRGFRDDVWEELAHLDILVHCSVTPEPFGQVVVEGMAAGLPVLASAAGGPVEVITHEVDGLLIAPGDVGQLADALARVTSDEHLRRQLGERARTTAELYSPQATAAALMSVYAATMDRRRRRWWRRGA